MDTPQTSDAYLVTNTIRALRELVTDRPLRARLDDAIGHLIILDQPAHRHHMSEDTEAAFDACLKAWRQRDGLPDAGDVAGSLCEFIAGALLDTEPVV